MNKQSSAQSLKSIKIKEAKSWISQIETINDESHQDDFKSPFSNTLFKFSNQQESSNNILYDNKYKNLLNNLIPQNKSEKKKSLTSLHSDRGSKINLNFSTDENKIFIENFEESKIFSNSKLI
jgi:hypothetical protein